ncbi:hypothetical protein ABIA35_002475 [Catenulispora sp. MAP12-49]
MTAMPSAAVVRTASAASRLAGPGEQGIVETGHEQRDAHVTALLLGGVGVGCRDVVGEQPEIAEPRPHRRRYRSSRHDHRVADFFGAARADQDAGDGGMSEWELQGCGAQRHAVSFADGFHADRRGESIFGGRSVVEGRAADGAGEQAGVEHASDHHGRAVGMGCRQQFGQAGLVEQGVAAGQQHHVHIGVAHDAGEHRGLVHAGADCSHDSLVAQSFQGRVGRTSDWPDSRWRPPPPRP